MVIHTSFFFLVGGGGGGGSFVCVLFEGSFFSTSVRRKDVIYCFKEIHCDTIHSLTAWVLDWLLKISRLVVSHERLMLTLVIKQSPVSLVTRLTSYTNNFIEKRSLELNNFSPVNGEEIFTDIQVETKLFTPINTLFRSTIGRMTTIR